jgi:hypothetical protein
MKVAFSEQPLKLVRGTAIYSGARGLALQADDMLETGEGTAQLDADKATIAIGPASRVYVRNGNALVLLAGWLKATTREGGQLNLETAGLQLGGSDAAATVHVNAGTTEIFAESGSLQVREGSGAGQRKTIPSEQFAVRAGNQPLKLAPRPPAGFLTAMPAPFKDSLVAVTAPATPVAPKRERAATYAELAPLLDGHPALRLSMQRRFAPPRPTRSVPANAPAGAPAGQY